MTKGARFLNYTMLLFYLLIKLCPKQLDHFGKLQQVCRFRQFLD